MEVAGSENLKNCTKEAITIRRELIDESLKDSPNLQDVLAEDWLPKKRLWAISVATRAGSLAFRPLEGDDRSSRFLAHLIFLPVERTLPGDIAAQNDD